MISLLSDDPPETGWSVMPGHDEDIAVPAHLEPPRPDADETLPTLVHSSYPFGRPGPKPNTLGVAAKRGGGWGAGDGWGSGSLGHGRRAAHAGKSVGNLLGTAVPGLHREEWNELNMRAVLTKPQGREVPPGMAGAKRPPSPPSPALRPHHMPPPRSLHLRHHLERHRPQTPPAQADPFDGPVPNETNDGYAAEAPSSSAQEQT